MYSIWSNNPKNTIQTLQKSIYIKTVDVFTNTEQNQLNNLFSKDSKDSKKSKVNIYESKDSDLPIGQERENVENKGSVKDSNDSNIKNEEKIEEQIKEKINFIQDIIEYIVPFLCIITVNIEIYTFRDIYNIIKGNETLLNITKSQFITWWGKNLPDNILDIIMTYYNKVNDKYDYDSITKRIKHIFLECKSDRKKFAETVIEYFKPTNLEKKNNAEIPTPRELKLEMINKVPLEFWTKKQKVLEPSVGKGGFCLEVIECFMEGLKELFPDENERYQIIVEECLYFADINPVNIFITKLILDPNNEYKLNYYEGDFLKFECKYVGLEGFDLIVGNPPYEKINSSGDNKLYLDFTKKSLELLKINSILLFITPRNILDYLLLVDKNRSYINELYQIDFISIETSNKYFEVSCIFTYFLLRKIKLYDVTKIEYIYNDNIYTSTIKLYNKFSWNFSVKLYPKITGGYVISSLIKVYFISLSENNVYFYY